MGKYKIMKICIIDGQGGGIGSAVIKRLKERFDEKIEVIALGTNAIATAQMLKARANKGASGSNAIIQTVKKADVIIGPVGIIMPHAMMGEVTLEAAEAICLSKAKKVLLPLTQENISIVGLGGLALPLLVDELIDTHLSFLDKE
jgi:NAD(P)-dependent dehydrogenase (short-subunit alcohol dehydrogenase family)